MGSSPMFPNIFYNSEAYLINHINFINAQKSLQIKIRITKRILNSIKSLNSIGCVSKFKLVKTNSFYKKYAYISVPFYKNTPFFKSIRLVSTPSKKHYLSLKGLYLVSKTLNASIMFLSTNKGILTHTEALKKKVGGLILYIVH